MCFEESKKSVPNYVKNPMSQAIEAIMVKGMGAIAMTKSFVQKGLQPNHETGGLL